MPSTLLFAINNEGRVFGLSTNGTKWREFIYLGLEFKQLSAVPNFLWALGGDRQIYVHAHGLDIPIRVKEEVYENERWTPFDGFSKKLLPTDRYNFSNHDGTMDRNIKRIRLPSMAWQWEGDWKLELSLDGQPLDHDGWTYAVDFPATYYPTKQWTSCVRRRKWVRYRKYIALNSWCAIAPLHKDPTQEPFIGVAIGGNQLPGAKSGSMFVWAVTACGRVMFRTEVSNLSPEGHRWSAISMPPGCEVNQISVGAAGLVWAVLWNGKALVRTGITKDCVTGDGWAEVEQPGENLLISQVSVGYNSVWAITRDFRVWFRKGVQGASAGVSENLAKGIGWIEMFGYMSNISVATNDQVWAVGAEDRILYFRTSVTSDDLMGKTWRIIGAPTQLSRANSSISITSNTFSTPREKRHRSWASLNQSTSVMENTSTLDIDFNEKCHSAPANARNIWRKPGDESTAKSFTSSLSSNSEVLSTGVPETLENTFNSTDKQILEVKEYSIKEDDKKNMTNHAYENISHPVCDFGNKGIFSEVAVPTRSWSPQHAGGTVVATEAHYAADSIVFESDELTGIYSEHGEREDEDDHLYWTDSEAFWSSVEAGACYIDTNYLPNWFSEVELNKKLDTLKPWRLKILNELKERPTVHFEGIESYEKAIDTSAWIKEGKCKCLLFRETNYKECVIELEWVCGENDHLDYGTFTLSSLNKAEVYAQINMRNIAAVINCSIPRNPRLALYYHSSSVLRLQFGTENEFEEWKSELISVCCRMKNISSILSSNSIWSTTSIGDIYVCDLSSLTVDQKISNSSKHSIEFKLAGLSMPTKTLLYGGFPPGSSLTIDGCVHDKADRFFINLVCQSDFECANVVFHFNPRFDENVVVQNSKKGSVWGLEERIESLPFNHGAIFEIKIICEEDCFSVYVDGKKFSKFIIQENASGFLLTPFHVTHLHCGGSISVNKINYSTDEILIEPRSMFWLPIDGHLKKVESAGGVTWGIGFDNTAWIYTGGKNSNARRLHDTHYYYVYENQRWNPLTGYTSHGLPTDRFMWSDVTGKHKRTRENTILLSKKWHWITDWAIDFQTPGGVDKEGWQYAVDFPSSYHGTKHFTDYVRRRRWFRCAKLETEGPWMELGYTPLCDISLFCDGTNIMAWAVASDGHVLFRRGVSKTCPKGLSWEHVASDEQILSISSGSCQVWAIGKSGGCYFRLGISSSNPLGSSWKTVEVPAGTFLKQISVGENGVWALDSCGRILARGEISSTFYCSSHWKILPLLSSEQNASDELRVPSTANSNFSSGFKQVAAKNKLWAVTTSGSLVYRLGTSAKNPVGLLWVLGIDANFLHISS